jgi:RimJ/RimL family protein N-acetyltransferase
MAGPPDLTIVALSSDRLSLQSFNPDDALEIFSEATPRIARYMTWDTAQSLEAFADVWQEWLRGMASGVELYLVVRQTSTKLFLGVAGLHRIGSPEPEVGIWIKEAAQGGGYGRETIAAICRWASAYVGAVALIYPVVVQNQPSRRLAESLHGVACGERKLRKSSGVIFDEIVYRIPVAS